MYIKSDEELSGVLQTLPEVFKERYQADIDWTSVLAHLKNELDKQKNQTIERQFSGWSVPSLLAMINTLERKISQPKPDTSVEQPKPDTSVEQPMTSNRKSKKKNG